MHALIHRALAPQTISSAWLVLTVALTVATPVADAIGLFAGLFPTSLSLDSSLSLWDSNASAPSAPAVEAPLRIAGAPV